MPFYEYECSACKFYVEALQKISDTPLKKCPSCKKQTLKRLMSAPTFRLAGGGWYETDFKSDKENKRNLVGDDKESASEPDAKPVETKPAEAKPAAETPAEKPASKTTASSKKSRSKVNLKSKTAAKKK